MKRGRLSVALGLIAALSALSVGAWASGRAALALSSSAEGAEKGAPVDPAAWRPGASFVAEVDEVIQVRGYTYLRVDEGWRSRWVATLKREADEGHLVEVTPYVVRERFVSGQLSRTFDELTLGSVRPASAARPPASAF